MYSPIRPTYICIIQFIGNARNIYHQISNISSTKSQNLNVSHLVLQLSLCNILKPGVEWRMKMLLGQCRQAMLQLHLSDQQFYCRLRCILYQRFDSTSLIQYSLAECKADQHISKYFRFSLQQMTFWCYLYENLLIWIQQVCSGSDNVFMPSDKKSSPEPIWIHDTILHY